MEINPNIEIDEKALIDYDEYEWSCNFESKNKKKKEVFVPSPILYVHRLNGSESNMSFYPCSDLKKLGVLKEVYNVTMVVSSVENKEYQEKISVSCYNCGVLYEKTIFDIISSTQAENSFNTVVDCLKFIYKKLIEEKHTLLVHSAGGSQRSKMIIYCLLRSNGEHKEEARVILELMTNMKRNCIGDYSLEFAEKYIVKELISEKDQKK